MTRAALAFSHARPARALRDVSAQLIDRYGFLRGESERAGALTLELGDPPEEREVRPMGPLMELTVRRIGDGGREVWRFGPMPRLVFHGGSKRLWVMGRGFKIDGRGFHPTGGEPRGLTQLPVESLRRDPSMRGQLREYVRTRYGVLPNEGVVGDIDLPREAVALAYVESVVYRTDRNDGGSTQCEPWRHKDGVKGCAQRSRKRDRDGMSPWEHYFEDEGEPRRTRFHTLPLLVTNATGTGLWFHGGSYSVRNGWLVG